MGKWELIIALAIFAVNGVLGYLAKREKEKARRQAEAEAAGLPPTRPSEPAPVPPRAKRPGGSSAKPGGVPAARGKATAAPVTRGRFQTPPAKPTRPAKPTSTPTPATVRSEPSPRPSVPVSAGEARRPAAAATPSAHRMRQGLRDPRSLREAIVWAEVLGRPRGLDPAGGSGV